MSDTSSSADVVRRYFELLAAGQFAELGELFTPDVVWHQPGNGSLAGTYHGTSDVFAHLARFAERSNGTFRIDSVDEIMTNNDLVAARIHFVAEHQSGKLAMNGADLMRVSDGLIAEVWLFSGDQPAEDAFWDADAS